MKNTLDTLLALQLAQGGSGANQNIEIIKKELPSQPITEFELFEAGIISSIRVEGEGELEAKLYVDGKKEYLGTGSEIIYDIIDAPLVPDDSLMRFEVEGEVDYIRIVAYAARLNLSASAQGFASYTHTQEEPSDIWEVNHNLEIRYPLTKVIIDEQEVVKDIEFIDKNKLLILLPEEKIGKAKIYK